jgi:hypothetical protein
MFQVGEKVKYRKGAPGNYYSVLACWGEERPYGYIRMENLESPLHRRVFYVDNFNRLVRFEDGGDDLWI